MISEETREKLRAAKRRFYGNGGVPWNKGRRFERMLGNQNAFKGDSVGLNARHYRSRKLLAHIKACEICGAENERFHMVVHHIDRDTRNNDRANLQKLCRRCHINVHRADLVEGRFYKGKEKTV